MKIIYIENIAEIKCKLFAALTYFVDLFPKNLEDKILIKPNFNSNFNALTGNTTDLRLLAGVIEFLQNKGYSNIIIGDGPSSGFDRERISVIQRLKVNRLASQYSIKVVDLNTWAQSIDVPLENGMVVQVANLLDKANFIINMPKLKTHYEVGMSVCLKNLIGTCIGRENKKKIHASLAKNIIHLNEVIKPHLHIVDGLIAMEGNGPSRGTPVNYGKVIIGTNPYEIDYLCARLIGFPWQEVKTLAAAYQMGHIDEQKIKEWDEFALKDGIFEFKKPSLSLLVKFVVNPHFQKHLIRIRYAPVVKTVCSTTLVKNIFYKLGISQERILAEEPDLSFYIDKNLCKKCYKCQAYCPIGVKWKDIVKGGGKACIKCLYCFSVCPNQAIKLEGDLGFFTEQLRLYKVIIRNMA